MPPSALDPLLFADYDQLKPFFYLHGTHDGCIRAGHFLQVERPVGVNRHIVSWLLN